mmetsp:Transcript_35898/g.92416  ORF Transcript_35898/g.92416 Transcript_35898/m.92416 type:complete len:388 (-) Transcript_35898:333-1496(-)
MGNVKLHGASRNVEDIIEDALSSLDRVLMRLLLGARETQRIARAAVGVFLARLNEHPLLNATPLFRGVESQDHDVGDTDQLLVFGRVEHEAAHSRANLVGHQRQRLGLVRPEQARVDVVRLQHLPEELDVVCLARLLRPDLVLLYRVLQVEDLLLLNLLLGPPLHEQQAAGAHLVCQGKALLEVGLHDRVLLATPSAGLVLLIQAVDQLLATLLDALVHVILLDVRAAIVRLVVLRVVVVVRVRQLLVQLSEPLVGQHVCSRHAHLLILHQHPLDEVLADRMHALGDLDLLALDVNMVPEGEAARDQAIHDDPHRPDVNLERVVLRVELRGPEDLGAHAGAQPLALVYPRRGAEVREHHSAARVCEVLAVHEVVVPLHVTVHHQLQM